MKLIGRIMNRMSVVLMTALLLWSMLFYFALVREMVDEVDDSLEVYSESLMIRYLAGEKIASDEIGTNNSYAIIPVTEDYVSTYPAISFKSRDIWIPQRHETEPARVMRMIFRNNNNQPMLLEVSTPTFDLDELQQAILIWNIALYLLLLVVILTINWGVIQSSMRPLYSMLAWMDKFDLRKNNHLLQDETSVSEFRKLIDAANTQVTRMQEIYDQQRQFVDNAAHEMQTPLAVCLNRLEELQQRTDLTEDQLNEIARVRQPLRRLNRLHRDMLQLSRIANGAYTDIEEVNISSLLNIQWEDFEEIYAYKQIRCSISGFEQLQLHINRTLAELLFGNLFRNAWIHTPEQGEIQVLLKESSVTFSNTGDEPLDAEQVFQRFYHKSHSSQSSGLGLSICESVCQQYGYLLSYNYESGKHHFTCRFKA